jgi:hypothetical protein
MDHSLYLPKLNALSVTATKMKHILSHSWLNYNWRTKAATDDLHHHRLMQVKTMITNSVVRTVWKQRYTPKKQNSGYHFMYLEDYDIQRRMNKQSGFNAEQIEKDNYPESKTVWRLNLKWQVNTAKQTAWLTKSTSNNKRHNLSLKVLHSLHRLTLGC